MDIAKEFDTVPHNRLRHKLKKKINAQQFYDLILSLHLQPKQVSYCREKGVNNGTWKGCTSSAYGILVLCIFLASHSG